MAIASDTMEMRVRIEMDDGVAAQRRWWLGDGSRHSHVDLQRERRSEPPHALLELEPRMAIAVRGGKRVAC